MLKSNDFDYYIIDLNICMQYAHYTETLSFYNKSNYTIVTAVGIYHTIKRGSYRFDDFYKKN